MIFFKRHIVLLTLSLLISSIAFSQDCSTETTEFDNGDGCGPGQWNWSGTSVPSSAEGGLCMEFGDGSNNGCFTAINNDGLMTDMTCDFCMDFAYQVDISGDVALPITADGFTFSLTNMASTTAGGGRCNETGCSDWSPGCGAGGFIGYNGIVYETIEESLTFEFDLYDNGGEAPAFCDEHLAIVDIDGNAATETILQSSCIASFNLEDGLYHTISICYDASATQITVSIDGTTVTTLNIDLSTYFTTEDCPNPSEVNIFPVFTSGWEPGVVGQLCDISIALGIRDESLAVELKNETVEVSWIEAKDYVTDYVVEKSTNGADFTHLRSVKAEEDNTKYVIVDESPIEGFNYYRVKEIEFTGIESYSEVKVVEYNKKNNFIIEQSSKEINIYSKNRADYKAYVFNSSGKLMKECSSFENVTIDVSDLSGGLYFVNIVSAEEVQTKKILLLND